MGVRWREGKKGGESWEVSISEGIKDSGSLLVRFPLEP